MTATVDDLDVDPMTWTAEMNECLGQLEVVVDEGGSVFGGPVVC